MFWEVWHIEIVATQGSSPNGLSVDNEAGFATLKNNAMVAGLFLQIRCNGFKTFSR
jgi:hypothetical protein